MITFIQKFFGDPNDKAVAELMKIVDEINAKEEKLGKMTREQHQAAIQKFKEEVAEYTRFQREKVEELERQMFTDETVLSSQNKKELKDRHEQELEKLNTRYDKKLTELLPDVYALIKNACRNLVDTTYTLRGEEKVWKIVPYDVQLVGGIVLHQGRIAEMRTGEGKTFVASMPLILNSLAGRGAHLITVNDYLASRDAEWMSHLYNYLGLTAGVVVPNMPFEAKRDAYASDITYGTNNEFGFDFLRDNMAVDQSQIVQGYLNYAIVDEVDSILIDEARTPLIISAPAAESTEKYNTYAELVGKLKEGIHYNIDEKAKSAALTEEGIQKMEELLGVTNIYTESGFREVHHIEQSLKAQACFKKDIDYVVKDGEILIVDEFTGRILAGRRYSQGLHQAIEAKENVVVQRESMTLATVTFQNLFRMYSKLSGMTGTAITEAEEFGKIYNLEVVAIPTNRPVARLDRADALFATEKGKYKAIAKTVKEKHAKGQPVLIGTISIEKSEALSAMLKREGVPHSVLNAKHHEEEANIVANAGAKGAVTIATNMAGRGTDIQLTKESLEAGGLAIIGTERHESRRIDNQLRGRSGRQGDAGESQFYVSMEDDLMRIFGGDRMKSIMMSLKVPEDMPIENKLLSAQIEQAQKRVENHHYDIRENVVKYDDVMNKHREIVYARRKRILTHTNLKSEVMELLSQVAKSIVMMHTSSQDKMLWDRKEIAEVLRTYYHAEGYTISEDDLMEYYTREELMDKSEAYLVGAYERREDILPDPKVMRSIERSVYLRSIDVLWMEHIANMQYLRQGVSMRGYGQRDPLIEYKTESFSLFEKLLGDISDNVVQTLFKVALDQVGVTPAPTKPVLKEREGGEATNADEVESVLYNNNVEMADIQKKQVQVIKLGAKDAPRSMEVGDDGVRLTRKQKKELDKQRASKA